MKKLLLTLLTISMTVGSTSIIAMEGQADGSGEDNDVLPERRIAVPPSRICRKPSPVQPVDDGNWLGETSNLPYMAQPCSSPYERYGHHEQKMVASYSS